MGLLFVFMFAWLACFGFGFLFVCLGGFCLFVLGSSFVVVVVVWGFGCSSLWVKRITTQWPWTTPLKGKWTASDWGSISPSATTAAPDWGPSLYIQCWCCCGQPWTHQNCGPALSVHHMLLYHCNVCPTDVTYHCNVCPTDVTYH